MIPGRGKRKSMGGARKAREARIRYQSNNPNNTTYNPFVQSFYYYPVVSPDYPEYELETPLGDQNVSVKFTHKNISLEKLCGYGGFYSNSDPDHPAQDYILSAPHLQKWQPHSLDELSEAVTYRFGYNTYIPQLEDFPPFVEDVEIEAIHASQ